LNGGELGTLSLSPEIQSHALDNVTPRHGGNVLEFDALTLSPPAWPQGPPVTIGLAEVRYGREVKVTTDLRKRLARLEPGGGLRYRVEPLNLEQDPLELEDRASENPEVLATMLSALRALEQRGEDARALANFTELAPLAAETRAELGALGYLPRDE